MATPRPLTRVLGIIAAALLVAGAAFAVGRFTALDGWTETATPGNASAEAGFARDMQVHHAQAVDMAMTIYAKTDDDDLRLLAYDMATSQQAQIGMMSEWLIQWNLPALGGPAMSWASGAHGDHGTTGATTEELQAAMGMASTAQLAELDAATGVSADCLFVSLMTRHHQGAIEMVDAALATTTNERVRTVAAQMAAAQQNELDVLASLAARNGCS